MGRLRYIASELEEHAPFTAFGAGVGVAVMAIFCMAGFASEVSYYAFHYLHPMHMFLSSIVTAAMFRLHRGGLGPSIAVGLVGALGICAISDVAFPYFGGTLLGVDMTLHICILDHPWLAVLPSLGGAAMGSSRWRRTKCPHALHVMISTLASLFYLMAFGSVDWLPKLPLVFMLLFVAVWIPCCTSDIVFPLLFARGAERCRGR
ncbi:MAG: hypothetical protein QXP65_02545 [Candidatus Hadarchaeales archaeon]